MGQNRGLAAGLNVESNREPLHRRLPRIDANGKRPADFMMLIPGLRNLAPALLDARLAWLHSVLRQHEEVIFVDLNLPLNLLWVSVSQRNGVINDLSRVIQRAIPEARLVGHLPMPTSTRRPPNVGPAKLAGPRRALLFWRRR